MERLYTAADLPEAHLILHMLRQARIEAHVFNENAQGGMGELPFTHTYPEVWIANGSDREQARRIIARYERPASPGVAVTCGECGEQSPGNFELCWRCGNSF